MVMVLFWVAMFDFAIAGLNFYCMTISIKNDRIALACVGGVAGVAVMCAGCFSLFNEIINGY